MGWEKPQQPEQIFAAFGRKIFGFLGFLGFWVLGFWVFGLFGFLGFGFCV